jgi:PAS domain S-box-containing protein
MLKKLLKNKKILRWKHWSILFASVLLTFIAWEISDNQVKNNREELFSFQYEQLLNQITERMNHYELALKVGASAIQSISRDTQVEQWANFSKMLNIDESYPGVNGIGIIYQIKKDNIDDFLKEQQQYRPGFQLHPIHEQQEYWPITYTEPVSKNAEAVGLDIAFENNRLSAAKKSRDTGTTQITAPIILVQDNKRTPGFLQYVPFYNSQDIATLELRQKHFVGHVYAPFIMSKLIEGAIQQSNRQLIFRITDENYILYDELNISNNNYDNSPLLQKKISINMYGREWIFHIQTANSFRNVTDSKQPLIILMSGIVINIMLLLLFVTLSRSEQKAIAVAKRITHKLSVKEQYYRNITEAAPCGIIIINDKGIIETVNSQSCSLFDYSEAELIGKNIDLLVPKDQQYQHKKEREYFNKEPSQRRMGIGRSLFGLKKDGSEFPTEIGLAQFLTDESPKTLATVIDMTKYVKVTEELKRSNQELDDFAYVASHDLKAPLRGIMQLGVWIGEDIEDFATEDTKENLSLLLNRAKRLENLLEDLLDYSRIGRKESTVQEIDTKELVCNIFDLQCPSDNIHLVCQDSMPVINAAVSPFETIMRNLIGNAIKHNNKVDGVITVTSIEFPKYYQFSVQDNGPGIPAQYHQKIFELFKTLQPRDEVEGSGMGLAIIKKLLDYHHGSITVESDGETGSCFTFIWLK